ncbi:MAG: MBL fold metallo-hydrolase [Candidatus Paceibacterota bacterium]|jgi:competence protein ComEC
MKKSILPLFVLLFINIIAFSFSLFLYNAHLEVSFFDVGQGDSIFIQTPQKHQILIDGGPSYTKVLDGLSSQMPFNDKEIDLVILSHPESDHMTGLLSVLENYKVDNILWTGIEREGEKFESWKRMTAEEGSNIYYADKGDKIIMNDVVIEVVFPFSSLRGEKKDDSNDTSVVVKLLYGDSSFLFTGDISSKIEKLISDVDVDVLKIPHHGSKYSTSDDFLNKTSPLISVIQVGKNSYGHPTEEVLTRISNFGIKVLRNDTDGNIKIVSDGINYKIITSK